MQRNQEQQQLGTRPDVNTQWALPRSNSSTSRWSDPHAPAESGFQRAAGRDAQICDVICDRLSEEDIDLGNLEVSVKQQSVTLRGEMNRAADMARVVRLAGDVPGVAQVNNQIEIARRPSPNSAHDPVPPADSMDDPSGTTQTGICSFSLRSEDDAKEHGSSDGG